MKKFSAGQLSEGGSRVEPQNIQSFLVYWHYLVLLCEDVAETLFILQHKV